MFAPFCGCTRGHQPPRLRLYVMATRVQTWVIMGPRSGKEFHDVMFLDLQRGVLSGDPGW